MSYIQNNVDDRAYEETMEYLKNPKFHIVHSDTILGFEEKLEFEPVKKDGQWPDDIYTIENFHTNVNSGGFIDYDGFGKLSYENQKSNIMVYPSDFERKLEKYSDLNFTHVVWYNR